MASLVGSPAADKGIFLRRAAELFDRMTLEDQEQVITFTQIEDRALELGRELERLLISHCIEKTVRANPSGEMAPCPKCRQPAPRIAAKAEERELLSRSGTVSIQRPKYRCASCRKTFFPFGRASAVGR